jgi:predicted transposase/invertase (TIGR01784 family)
MCSPLEAQNSSTFNRTQSPTVWIASIIGDTFALFPEIPTFSAMSSLTHTPHDAIFKKLLSHPDTARDFLEIHLPPALREVCDLATLRPESASFIDPGLRATCSDILYSLRTVRGEAYVYCLIEHQSTSEHLMAFRLMEYCLRAMRLHLDKGHKELPLVIPILFYHGQTSPYPHGTCWLDDFADPELARALYSGSFPLVDVTVIPDDKILTHKRAAALEFLQKHIRQRDIKDWLDPFANLVSLRIDREQLEICFYYILQASHTSDPKGLVEQLVRRLPDQKEIVMTAAEYLREEGVEIGLERGREEEKRSVARSLLGLNQPLELIVQATGLSREVVQSMAHHSVLTNERA